MGRSAIAHLSAIDGFARRAALDELRRRTERGEGNAALTQLDRLVAAEPDDVGLLCERATLLAGLSRFDRADADIRRAAKLDEHHPDVLLAVGVLACKRARWRDAIVPLREAIAMAPHAALPHYYLGEAHNHVDDLPLALDAYERAAQLDPSNWRALKGVGVVLDRLGRSDEAAEAYRRSRDVRTS